MLRILPQEVLEKRRAQYPKGTRIRLIEMDDEQAPPAGCCGTVRAVDDLGSLIVAWDNGSSLHVIYEIDEVEILDAQKGEKSCSFEFIR